MLWFPLLPLLLLPLVLAWEVGPGEAFTLVFPGVEGEAVLERSLFRSLLQPRGEGGLALAVLEVPPTLSPGSYSICIVPRGGERRPQEVRVRPLRRLLAEVPSRGVGGVALRLENRGNLPERVRLAPAPESPLAFPPVEALLGPEETKDLYLSFPEGGELFLLLAHGEGEERRVVRIKGQGEPLPSTA